MYFAEDLTQCYETCSWIHCWFFFIFYFESYAKNINSIKTWFVSLPISFNTSHQIFKKIDTKSTKKSSNTYLVHKVDSNSPYSPDWDFSKIKHHTQMMSPTTSHHHTKRSETKCQNLLLVNLIPLNPNIEMPPKYDNILNE